MSLIKINLTNYIYIHTHIFKRTFFYLFFQVSIAGQPAGVESARVRIRVTIS